MNTQAIELTPGLVLVHGNRAEQLRDVLAAWMQHSPLEPLENECVLVQSNGIAQWLRLALADNRYGGVAAALDFLLPSRFMWQAYRSVLGPESVPERSALDKDALVWRLMRLLPELSAQARYAVLQQFLADDPDVRKRYQLACQVADIFDQYQVYRADWLQAWAEGRQVLPGMHAEPDIPETQVWQAHLWQDLLADLAADPQVCSLLQAEGRPVIGRAAIHEAFMAKVQTERLDQRPQGLPRRILVFGISAMPRQAFEALAALSRWVQVLVCVHNPCAHYWADIQGGREVLRARFKRQARRPGLPDHLDEAALHQQTHPLLASWGRQGRDYIGMLDDFDDPAQRDRWIPQFDALHQRIDAFETLPGATLLAQLQDDMRDLRPLSETRQRWPAIDPTTDHSICFHVAHGALREIEILQDQLLAAFDADPSLHARDVIVMVPDIDTYAPHIQAVFGLYGPQDARHIPYNLADRSTRQTDPLMVVLEQLLFLPRQRLGLYEVLEWLEVPALRRCFEISAEDLPAVQAWAREARVRWGLHAGHRDSFDLAQSPQAAYRYTWQFGFDRMLLGHAAGASSSAWQGIEPYAEPSGLQAVVLGGIGHLLDRLDHYWQILAKQATPGQWLSQFQSLLADFFVPDTDAEALILGQFRESLLAWFEHCEAAGLQEPLPSSIVAEHCLAQIDRSGLSQRFFAGSVTFATLMPMRAIPFRRVCLLGMQDGEFPRRAVPSDMDLMVSHPRPGDRSRREDDRYLFLEAVLSARDQLYLSWVGRSILDNAEQPPSVLISQLRDHLDRGWQCTDTQVPVSEALTCLHPLQPFSLRYFPSNPLAGAKALFTYAHEWRSRLPATQPSAVLAQPDDDVTATLKLEDLQRFLKTPVEQFYRRRLRVGFNDMTQAEDEEEPYLYDGLQKWQLDGRLLEAVCQAASSGVDLADSPQAGLMAALDKTLLRLQGEGGIVDGSLGDLIATRIKASLVPAIEQYIEACTQWPLDAKGHSLRLSQMLPGTSNLAAFEDTLGGWRQSTDGQWARVILQPSHLVKSSSHYAFKNMVAAWVEHITAHVWARPSTLVLISPKGKIQFDPLPVHEAQRVWGNWWAVWQQSQSAPLPIEIESASAWLRAGADPDPDSGAWQAAEKAYQQAQDRSLCLRRSYADFSQLVSDGRFFDLANTLYGSLAAALPQKKQRSAGSKQAFRQEDAV